MKKILIALCLLFISLVAFAQESGSQAVLGKWYTEGNKSVVEIKQIDAKFFGNIIFLKEPMDKNDPTKPKLDDKNKVESLRNFPLIGIEFLKGFKYDGKANKWVDGAIYNPEDGNTYFASMVIEKDGRLLLRGSLDAWGLIGKSQYWTREPSAN